MRWHTLYNKNIVLNILSNIFGEQIEDYVQNCVIRLENNILEKYFNTEVDFAWMSTLNQMVVENYNIDLANNEEIISGNLKVQAQIDGFVLEEKEGGFRYKDSVMLPLTLLYRIFRLSFELKSVNGRIYGIKENTDYHKFCR